MSHRYPLTTTLPYLHSDILLNIFPKTNLKTFMRCTTLSKYWHKELRTKKVVVANHSSDDDAVHVAVQSPSRPSSLLLDMLHWVQQRNHLPVIDGVRTFMVWNPMTYRHIIIQDTFYIDTEKTHSFYAFGHNHPSTDYSIVHVYGMAEEMKMRMYSSSSAQWSQEQGAPSYIHYFDGAPIVCNGVVYWVDKIIEERPFPHSIVTYSLDARTWHEATVLEEANEEIQKLVIHNGVPALLTHPDHLDEFDANL
ncbi:hypothetical protein PIB30_067620 [Stylosanthes scabra]|uniref:F-box domain-containing protein n=1 Tax=Stylosanthes scabra TaxID=79078 RepID=A0ABU6TME6_9FABA|nr:hypothetical protein [Stylosanthes scabra]